MVAIEAAFADAVGLQRWSLEAGPVRAAFVYGPGTSKDEAAACLQDATDLLGEARFALVEARAHRHWYALKAIPTDPFAAVFWSQFYLDDAILRIYSSGEAIACFVELFLDFDGARRTLSKADRKSMNARGSSRLARLCLLLAHLKLTGAIVEHVTRVINDNRWSAAVDYRNKWVHEQRPRIHGLGITYRRRQRWMRDDATSNTWSLGFGGGDPADIELDELFKVAEGSYHELWRLVEQCCLTFEDELSRRQRRFPQKIATAVKDATPRPRRLRTNVEDQAIDHAP